MQLPDASLERDGSGALVPPTATARMMPQDFTLTITTKTADHVLEVKNLFNSIDPRESGTTVDPDSGLVTLRLAKWYDNTNSMIDYFDTAWYNSIKVGDWDKPVEII